MEKLRGICQIRTGCFKNNLISGGEVTKGTRANEIQRILECPVCISIPVGQIFNCVNGHIICGDCRQNTFECGLCRGHLTNIRNIAAENIAATSKIACEYRENGCDFISTGDKLRAHHDNCKFRPLKFQCMYGSYDGCNFSVFLKDNYIAHLSNIHGAKKLEQAGGKFRSSYLITNSYVEQKLTWDSGYVLFDGKIFILYCSCENDSFRLSLHILDSEIEADKYKVRMIFTNPGVAFKNSFADITVPVVSIRCSEKDVVPPIHCVFSRTKLIQYCQEIISPRKKRMFACGVTFKIKRKLYA